MRKLSKKPLHKVVQEVSELHYLKPYDGSDKQNLYQLPVERVGHGVMHINRVAILVNIITNLYRAFGHPDALAMTEDDLYLLQIVALFHDVKRQNDQEDKWEHESAAAC